MYYRVFDHVIKERNPLVTDILSMIGIHPSILVVPWFRTLFSAQLDIENLFKLWDVLFLKGEIVIFRMAFAVFDNLDLRNKDAEAVLNSIRSLDTLVGPSLQATTANTVLTKEMFESLLTKFKE